MKRMIACEECAKRVIPKYAGEWFKRTFGIAKTKMVCDWCMRDIDKNERCAAESFGVDGQGIPYYRWESEYMKVEE